MFAYANVRRAERLLAALGTALATSSVSHADEPLALRGLWSGRIGYFATGATLALDGPDADTNVDTLVPGTLEVTSASVPADAALMDAFLYWGGSVAGLVDTDVVFTPPGVAATSVTADECHSSATASNMQLCRARVGHLLPAFLGTYRVEDFAANIQNSSTDNASFSLVLIFQHPSLPSRRVMLQDGLLTLAITTSLVQFTGFGALAAIPDGTLTWYALDGDVGGAGTEAVEVDGAPGANGPVTLGDAINPAGNPMNHTINTTVPPRTDVTGVDIDSFDITAALSASDTTVDVTYRAGTDQWWLAYTIIGLDTEPDGDLIFRNGFNAGP